MYKSFVSKSFYTCTHTHTHTYTHKYTYTHTHTHTHIHTLFPPPGVFLSIIISFLAP